MRPEKQAIVGEIRDNLSSAEYALLVDFAGMTVEQGADLRGRLAQHETRLQVVKNSLLGFVAGELGRPLDEDMLQGPTAMVYGSGDVAAVAKTLTGFYKEKERVAVKGGCLGQRRLSLQDVEALAKMPSREVLLGMVVGTIAAPMSGMVGVLSSKLRSLLYVLRAVEEKKAGAQ